MDSHDDTLRPDELLAQLGWVRALARSLVADHDVTDDVLQQVCLLALQQAPRDARAGPRLRAWLATVTRTLVRNTARGDIRRTRREHSVAQPEATPSTIDIAAHQEALKRLVEAVTSLEEPYYSVVFARYFDGRTVAEIAELRGMSSAAIRQQLSRARARLRARLHSLLADHRHGWFLSALPLGSASGSLKSASAKPLLAHSGGLLVAKTVPVVVTAVAGLLGVAGWFALHTSPEGRPQSAEGPVVLLAQPHVHEPLQHEELPAALQAIAHPIEIEEEAAAENAPTIDDSRRPEVPHVSREGNPLRMFVLPDYFAEKYADATLDELKSEREAIEERVHAETTKATTGFLDSGRGEFEIRPRAASLDEAPKESVGETFALIHMQRTNVTADGQVAVEKGRLPWEENVALYDDQDEMFWLISEIRKRKAAALAADNVSGNK